MTEPPLQDQPALIAARPGLIAAPRPSGLPAPRENLSVNILPVQGTVLIRYPGSRQLVILREAIQVPVGSLLDTTAGRVELVSDKGGGGRPQSATFWNGRFTVGYTRAVVAAGRHGKKSRSSRRASRPITELTLANTCRRGARASSAGGKSVTRAARRRRGLFGRGKGRFRTRGSRGAGTVRGTYWYTENRCGSTFFRVYTGIVDVRDFARKRTVKLRRGQRYLAGSRRSKSN